MQGIVLAIIISTLSPEGMNGATAVLYLSAKAPGLFGASACLVKAIQYICPPTSKEGGFSIINYKATLAFSFAKTHETKQQL